MGFLVVIYLDDAVMFCSTVTTTIEVDNPGQHGLPYMDLELKAEDGITLRCYLLLQAKYLPQPDAAPFPPETIVDGMSDEEVSALCLFF